MSDGPYYPWRRLPIPSGPPPREDTPAESLLCNLYYRIRVDINELEEVLANPKDLTIKDQKRLDKAVTLMKVGVKLMKFVLHTHGFKTKKQPSNIVQMVTVDD